MQTRQSSLEVFEAKGPPDRAITHAFAGMLFALDESIGRVLDVVERLGIEDNTYLILMADNGGRDPVPGGQKTLWPPKRPLRGAKRYPSRDAYDLLPKFYNPAGGTKPLPMEIDGGSTRSDLEAGGFGAVKRSLPGLVFHRPLRAIDPSSVIRVGDYKLMIRFATSERQRRTLLFDLAFYVEKHTDLSDKLPEKANELEGLLLGHLKSVDAETPKQ